MQRVVVLGGGVAGLAAALYLDKTRYEVTVLEKETAVGGLARSIDFAGRRIPITYHHIKACDKPMLELADELGMSQQILWYPVNFGLWFDGRPYKFSQPWQILRFNKISVADKLRLLRFGWKLLWLKPGKLFAAMNCRTWLVSELNERLVHLIFDPLARIKFGRGLEELSTNWMISRLHESAGNRNRYAYPEPGLEALINRLIQTLSDQEVTLIKDAPVTLVERDHVVAGGARIPYDFLVSTLPPPVLIKVASPALGLQDEVAPTCYKSMLSVIFTTRRRIAPIYFNIFLSPSGYPWGGIVEHSQIAPADRRDDYIYHSFAYLNADAALYHLPDAEIIARFTSDLNELLGFSPELITAKVIKIPYASIVYTRDYQTPPRRSGNFPRLFLAGTYMNFPETRTMAVAIKSGRRAAELLNRG